MKRSSISCVRFRPWVYWFDIMTSELSFQRSCWFASLAIVLSACIDDANTVGHITGQGGTSSTAGAQTGSTSSTAGAQTGGTGTTGGTHTGGIGTTGGTGTGGNIATGGSMYMEMCGIAVFGGCNNGVIQVRFGSMCVPLTVTCDNGCITNPGSIDQNANYSDVQAITRAVQTALCNQGTQSTGGTSSIGTGGGSAGGTSSVSSSGGTSAVTTTLAHNDYATCTSSAPAPSDADALFVSAATGVDDATHGAALAPFKTVNGALTALAQSRLPDTYVSQHKFIIVDEGVYSPRLDVPAYVTFTVVGGWNFDGSTWKRDCRDGYRSRTVIGGDAAVGVQTPNLDRDQNAGFYGLTIKTKPEGATLPGQTGESLIGVSVLGHSQVALVDVDVVVGRAGNGGTVTQPNAAGNVTCDGRTCPGGVTPAVGANGASATVPGTDGAPGNSGSNGPNGSPGGPGAEGFCATSCAGQCASSPSTCGGSNGSMAGAGNGRCGCGGLGGDGGLGGKGGGSAVGVVQEGLFASVVIERLSVSVGGGGDGSSGSRGGAGGPGTTGSAGNPSANCPACRPSSNAGDPACSCQLTASVFPGGAAGSAGAAGSSGGDGGGGAGGDALGIVITPSIANNLVDVSQLSVSLEPAGTGTGGAVSGRSSKLLVK
jgi:hypothetical protein